ncbi:HypC/HybG/HupF family hydrogenase formation chaperone [Anaerovorax odorimutans]|uniref:HypC/HybG/HupF family hydrogenase formation chaperone n=1 Tax=Anaerovorax odorimutans TaxID=109327 RepID=UPI00041811CA|nr:HypC/HybG/HupF family hydrogenase formation chaperone [Anaerovorax odorimutans]
MCVAMPGKILSIDGNNAKADFKGNIVDINTGIVDAKIGDYVLVHAGCAIEVMAKEKAQDLIDLFQELEDIV